MTSDSGEVPRSQSIIGFRGTRFSVSRQGLYLTDYSNEKTFYEPKSEAMAYIHQIRGSIGDHSWTGRMRIRYGGDTYCKVRGGGVIYAGKTNLGDDEKFRGYSLSPGNGGGPGYPKPYLYSGPHNHNQVGERWTIPESRFASRNGAIGNVGIKTRGAWTWSSSKHHSLISSMRSMFRLEKFLRIYITCYGQIVRPIQEMYWEVYRIPVLEQAKEVNNRAPTAVVSMSDRKSRAEEGGTTFYFTCGTVDELMSGTMPQVDTRDGNSRNFDEDGR